MSDSPNSSSTTAPRPRASSTFDPLVGPRADLARTIPRRPHATWWTGVALAAAFAVLVLPAIAAERLFVALGAGHVMAGQRAAMTVRVPMFAGVDTAGGHLDDGGVVIARGDVASRDDEVRVVEIAEAAPKGAAPYFAYLLLAGVFAGLFTHHTRRSNRGRLIRVQVVSLALVVVAAIAVKALMLATAVSVLVVPVAVCAMVPTLVLDRVVGLATGTLAALVIALVVPFDVGVAIMLLVQAGTAGLVIAERPKQRWRAALVAGAVTTVFTAVTYPLMEYLTTGHLPLAELGAPLHSAWIAAGLGPAIATAIAVPLVPLYQLLVGEITHGELVRLEDLSHPLLRQIAERSPGTWQHSLMMANMAELAANAIGANGRLVRVGAYFHDLGKSLHPKYFIENLEPGETSPHDQLPPDVSCDAIFAHVTEGIVAARRAKLHERIVDFMHMHHGNGVLEYFWGKCKEQGNREGLTVEHFRYPGVAPQSRETAILAICDAVEAASRTLKKPEPAAIDNLVQRIVYGKLHLGQLDDSGLSMADLRRIADSLRETIRHANHGRIEYPWQKAQQDASASVADPASSTGPRLDSLDVPAKPAAVPAPAKSADDALADTADVGDATPILRGRPEGSDRAARTTQPSDPPADRSTQRGTDAPARTSAALATTAPIDRKREAAVAQAWRIDEAAGSKVDAAPREIADEDTGRRSRKPASPEAAQFAAEAVLALHEASKDMVVLPREAGEPPRPLEVPESAEARKRAATLPPVHRRRPPTLQSPVVGRRPATVPPIPPIPPPATASRFEDVITIPPASQRRPALIVDESATAADEAPTTPPSSERVDDASTTQPRLIKSEPDDARSRTPLPLPAPASSDPQIALPAANPIQLAHELARFERRLDDDFGGDTPVKAPSRAELQALLDSPPDPTRRQSLDELEALHRASQAARSDPHLQLTRRAPYPTAEVDDADIEAAIELAPPARRDTSIGVAKKKPTE